MRKHYTTFNTPLVRFEMGSIFDAMFHPPPPTNESQKERKLKVYIFFLHKDLLLFSFCEINNIYKSE